MRPLAVKRSFQKDFYTLDLSRRSRIDHDLESSWMTLFGGKLTDCIPLAKTAVSRIEGVLQPPLQAVDVTPVEEPEFASFPGLPGDVPSAAWCLAHEMCMTLEDYLRRRTNISQWIARGGFGLYDENLPHLLQLCLLFCGNDEEQSWAMLHAYQKKIDLEFDGPLRHSRRFGLRLPLKEKRHAS